MKEDPTSLSKHEIQILIDQLKTKDLFIDSGTEGIGIAENGIILLINKQLVKMFGYDSPDELIGQPIINYISPQSRKLVALKLTENLTKPYESFFKRKDGSEFPGLIFARNAKFTKKIVRIATIRDITDFYDSRKMLESSENRYRSLFNQIPVTIWEEDASELLKSSRELGLENIDNLDDYLDKNPDIIRKLISKIHIVNVNETALDLLNLRDKETLVNLLPQFFSSNSLIAFKKVIIAITGNKTYFESESEFINKNGEKIDIHFIWSVVPGYEKTYSKIISIITDITSRKKVELERKEMDSRYQQIQKLESLGTFAGSIAHDFNNLLMGILGNANLALNQIDPASPIVGLLKEIEEVANKASNLTKQLQAYSGKGKITKELFNLNDLIKEMQGFIKMTIPSEVKIATNLSKTAPWIEADRAQVKQIIINLLINASESMDDKGTISLKTFHITKETLDDHLGLMILHPKNSAYFTCLEIIDTGKGIEHKLKRKIFDPFYSNNSKGKGLGLSVVQGIIKGHEGGLLLDTRINEGTSFKILFPLSVNFRSLINDEKPEIKDSHMVSGSKIMVIDDEPVVLSVACKLLRKIGFDPIAAVDGYEAINIFHEKSDIKLVILDLTMEKISAQQTFSELRKLNPKLPIVISSGFSRNEVFQQFGIEEKMEFLQKPYSISELEQIILSLI
ncbi:MAG: Blue-light-activated protein [Candidatus Heimdallarchaeota archaeon LC_2]|nr:MAG: Blue-light-activated protein [Candidatus Heimdallarchaeota archaeon LC_2]